MMSLSANRIYQEPPSQSHFYPVPPRGSADGLDSKHLPFSTLSHFHMRPPQKEDLSPLAYSTYSLPTIPTPQQALLQYPKYQPPPIPRTTHPSQLKLANINFSGGNFNGGNFNAVNFNGVNCSGVNLTGGNVNDGNVNGGNSSIPHFDALNSNTNTTPPPRNLGPINMGSSVNFYKGRDIYDGSEHKEKTKGKESIGEDENRGMEERGQGETGREEKREAVQKEAVEKGAVKEEADWRRDAKREAVNLRREGSYMAGEWVRHNSESSVPSTEWELSPNKRPKIQIKRPQNIQKSPLLSCEHCGKMFAKAYNLRSHARSHSTERPYKCRQCPKAFARSHDKTRHEQLHRGVKNFKCEGFLKDGVTKWGCGKSFARSDALSRHFRTETGWGCVRVFMEEAKTPISDHATVPEHMSIPSGGSQEHLPLPSVYSSPETFSSSPAYGAPLYAESTSSSSPPASSFYQAVASKQTANVQVLPQLSLPSVSYGYYPFPVQNDRPRFSYPVSLPPLLRH